MAGLHDKFYKAVETQGNSINIANYLWNECIKPQLAYSFSKNHTMPYSAEALQEMNLYHFYPHVFWNCSVLNVNAGLSDTENAKSTDYGKIAKAIYRSIKFGVPVSPPSINNSDIDFTPIEETNSIFFGLGGIAGINQNIIDQIISNRPYTSFKDFYTKNSYDGSLITNSKFIQLIKAGCFDEFEPNRIKVMKQYIVLSTPTKTELTMQNLPEIMRIKAKLPRELTVPYNFKRYVCSKQFLYGNHPQFKSKKLYWLDDKALRYFNTNCRNELQEGVDWFEQDDMTLVVDKAIEKLFKPVMDALKEYINRPEFIKEYNKCLYRAKYEDMLGDETDLNMWSFTACSFFSQQHYLANIDYERYDIVSFDQIPEEPKFITNTYRGRTFRRYELYRVAGVVLAKNDNSHFFTMLDFNNNVLNVKMDNNMYAKYKAQISEEINGKKKVLEKSWFTRGTPLIVTGYRTGHDDGFILKTYKNSVYNHKIQKITSICNETGEINVQTYRHGDEREEY